MDTKKASTLNDDLDMIRHSTAHLLAQSVKQLYPKAQVTIGPVIEDGFYYDFYYPEGFKEGDLTVIEQRMKALAKADLKIQRKEMSRQAAIELFQSLGETYKVKIIESIPEGEVITVYQQGDFVDLCRGPHVASTAQLTSFKLTKLAGAYWLGDSNNVMLQRIYGTAWQDDASLEAYLKRLEEAGRRDHRKLAVKMDLFHLQTEAPGMVFWHPKGWVLYRYIQSYIRDYYHRFGYVEVKTPSVVSRSLLEQSGHWDKFGQGGIFVAGTDQNAQVIRPMNCPCHVAFYKHRLTSYKDLPIRVAEFGSCYRNEPSGTLHGLMRVREFVQDDGHIFCREDQIQTEAIQFIEQVQKVYKDFGFSQITVRLSTRPEQRIGSDRIWDSSEAILKEVLSNSPLQWELAEGEGAFYGPKIEFSLNDCLGRVWQCGTIQLDFYVPGRLGAYYIDEQGDKQVPVMLHRAILGSIERFIGILLEHTEGKLPLWLSPVQVVVANISDHQLSYAKIVLETLKKMGVRAQLDLRNEKIGYKIRASAIARTPYMVIIGDREQAEQCITVRTQSGQNLGKMTLETFMDLHIKPNMRVDVD